MFSDARFMGRNETVMSSESRKRRLVKVSVIALAVLVLGVIGGVIIYMTRPTPNVSDEIPNIPVEQVIAGGQRGWVSESQIVAESPTSTSGFLTALKVKNAPFTGAVELYRSDGGVLVAKIKASDLPAQSFNSEQAKALAGGTTYPVVKFG